ncbi:hypothetical protein TEA_027723 [Camellia sinensis var. sinensis]|uniref:Cytochrome P450 n=1 Tax=Camellia sinensis var. sinensis TaxID=542762 RepID=A0A4S4D2S2_CAMSN|nr:hypothetical protein TEA_027723 [Camellia sinensis var. sinensis]
MSTIVVSSPEIVREVMKTHDIVFVQRPYSFASRILSYDSQNIAFSPYGNYWRQMQKICIMELLSAKRVQSFRAIREEKRVAFGGKTKGQEEFVSIVEEVADLIGGFTIVDIERKRITESGEREEEDLVDVLLRIQKHGDLEFPLTDNNIKAVILVRHFQCGKRDIINNRRSGNVRNAENPQVMKRAQAKVRRVFDKKGNVNETCLHKLKYLNLVIKETLRLHTSAPLLVPRESGEQCTINGYDILAKTKVIVNAWAIGQDPKYWNEAEKFDPERFLDSEIDFKGRDFEFTPFGAGRRICPGISFAIPNIELPLAQLLYHFDWKLPDGKKYEELDIEEDLGLIVRRKNYLILIPIPYYQILFFLLSKNTKNIC